jgi:hypothetical protein
MTNETDIHGPLKSAEVVTVPKDEALAKFREYEAAVRAHHSEQDAVLRDTYKALSEGYGVINLAAAMHKAGGHNGTCFPRLAVMRADQEFVFYKRRMGVTAEMGSGIFSYSPTLNIERASKSAQGKRLQFVMPAGTFGLLERNYPAGVWKVQRAPLPIIPPKLRPADSLTRYCVLWEVAADGWTTVEPPRPPHDPMLLRPLGQAGLYAVVAHWDLTDVERMVLGGLLGQ